MKINDETYLSESPYPGLRAFQRDEADIFFGREEQTDQLLARLQQGRFLAIVGPSGCGKSSLVRAGMIAALETGFLADVGARWRIAEMRPGEQPLARLANALLAPGALGPERAGEADAAAFLLAALKRGPLGLIEAWRETPPSDQANLLLLVDQFEEIFRFRSQGNADEADAFVALLLATAAQREAPIYVVITMRSDFLGECALFGGLPEAINEGQYLTPRLTRDQRQAAIVGPARVFGGDVAPELVNRLLNDMGPNPDQLPLLQHAMMRMWRLASARSELVGAPPAIIITLEDYAAVGTLDQALSLHADEVFNSFTSRQQHIAEVMFRRLTERAVGKRDTRRPARLSKVADVATVPVEDVIEVVEACRLPGRSFITPPPPMPLLPETILDIGHESLIRQWRRLNEWVQEEAQSADSYQRLKQTALLWKEGNSEPLGAINLERMLAWEKRQQPTSAWASRYGNPEEFALAMEFLRVSEQEWQKKLQRDEADAVTRAEAEKQQIVAMAERRRYKQLRIGLIAVSFLVVALAALSYYAFQQRSEAKQQTCIATSRGLAAQADIQLREGRLDLAFLLGAQAYDTYNTFEARNTLLNLLTANGRLLSFLPGPEDGVNCVAFSPDGKILAAAGADKKIVLWDAVTRQPLASALEGHTSQVTSVAFSPDGKLLASGSYDKTVRLWDWEKRTLLHKLEGHGLYVLSVAFSPDGKFLASGSKDTKIGLWEINALASAKLVKMLEGHADYVTTVAFQNDNVLASGGRDKTIRFWDVKNLSQQGRPIRENSEITTIAFNSDGKRLATNSSENSLQIWNTETRQPFGAALYGASKAVKTVSFSPDGKQIAAGSYDNTVYLWNLETDKEPEMNPPLKAHQDYVYSVAFAPDGKTLASSSRDGSVVLWDTVNEFTLGKPALGTSVNISRLAFSVEGKLLASAGDDNKVLLWDTTARGQLERPLATLTVPIKDIAFHPRKEMLAVGGDNGTLGLWPVTQDQPPARLEVSGANNGVNTVAFSPDGRVLACGVADKTIRFWNTETYTPTGKIQTGLANAVSSLAFSSDGKLLFSANGEKQIQVWDVAKLETAGNLMSEELPATSIALIATSPDGKLLASVIDDKNILFWDLVSRRPLAPLLAKHQDRINSLAFSGDGSLLASSALDKTILLWDVATRQPLGPPIGGLNSYVNAIAFGFLGPQLASGYSDGSIRFWDVNFASWKTLAERIANRKLSQIEEGQFGGKLGQCTK